MNYEDSLVHEQRTPEHDKMVLWAYKNLKKILKVWDVELGNSKKILERPITKPHYRNERIVVGFADIFVDLGGSIIVFEIKPKIESLGDTLRQINFYRANLQIEFLCQPIGPYRMEFVLISPDDRYAQQFEEQEIRFYKYPEKSK